MKRKEVREILDALSHGQRVYALAYLSAQLFEDYAHQNEAEWSGYGEQTIPATAVTMRVKAGQAAKALRDAG